GAGDINGDGFDDLIIGDYAGANYAGTSYVVFGKASGFGAHIDLPSLSGAGGFHIDGETFGDLTGTSVAGAGDVNGDGFDDLLIGANSGTYVVFGKAGGFTNLNLSALDGSNGFQVSGEAASDVSGGDFNGDGFADLIIGAIGADPNGTFC